MAGRGGLSLPVIPENETEKWKEFYSKKLPGTTTSSSSGPGPKAPQNDANTVKTVKEDVATAEAAFNNANRRKKHQKPLHRGKHRSDEENAKEKKAAIKSHKELEEERRKKQREEIDAKKKERQAENKKGQSDFRAMQLSLATPAGIHEFLKTSLFATNDNSNNDDNNNEDVPRKKNKKHSTSNSFSDPKHLGIFMQALLSAPQRENKNNNNKDDDAKQNQENGKDEIPRPLILQQVLHNQASKPYIWSLLALVHSVARRAPGFLATSPSTLKFIGFCDSFGVATEKWSSDIPSSVHNWEAPALAPNSLIRQIEEKSWYEYLAARVEFLYNAKEVRKFCKRISQQGNSLLSSSSTSASSKKQRNDDDEQEQEDGVIHVSIPQTKLALLASKFASKLLRSRKLFFADEEGKSDDANTEARKSNIATVTVCINCLDLLTNSQKELTTLKKVSHACKMMLKLLGVVEPETNDDEEDDNKSSSSSSSGGSDDDDEDGKKQDKAPAAAISSAKEPQERVVPGDVKSLVELIDKVALRCQGGGSEEEVALASARQLMAVAKFKAAETANGISRIIDEIVEEEGDDDEDEESENKQKKQGNTRPAGVKERITVQGDDVVSAMSVAMNTLLGPPQRIVQFSDEMLFQDHTSGSIKKLTKKEKKEAKKKKALQQQKVVLKKSKEDEELDAELDAEMKGISATNKETASVGEDSARPDEEEKKKEKDDGSDNENDGDDEEKEKEEPVVEAATSKESPEDEKKNLQKRVMALLEFEVSQGRALPRRAQHFLDRCRQELRRRQREE